MPKLTNRWAVLALMVALRICFGYQFQTIPPISGFVMADLGINYTQMGLLIGLYIFPGIFIALPGGVLGARFGDKNMLVGGAAMMVLGDVIFGASDTFASALAGRMIGGTGGVLITVQQAKIVTERFAGREIATAMSMLLAGYPLGIAIALTGLGPLAAATSWQTAILAGAGAIAAAGLLIVLLFGNLPAPESHSEKESPRFWHLDGREFQLICLAGLVWTFLNAAFIVYLGFTPAMLTGRGFSLAAAGFTVSLTTWVSMATVPLGGYLTDRTGKGDFFIVFCGVSVSLSLAALALGGPPAALAVAYGLLMGAAPGAIMALPGEVLRPESRSTGFGVFYAIYYLGLTIFPPIAGWLRDASGEMTLSLLFGAGLMAMTPVALGLFRLAQRRLSRA